MLSRPAAMARRLMGHRLMLPLYAPSLIYAVGRSMLIPVLPVYAGTFTENLFLIGLVLSGLSLGQLLGDVPAGLIQRRLGRRRAMLLGLAVEALAITGMALAGSVWVVLALSLVGGFGTASYNLTRHDFISTAVQLTRRGRAIAVFGGVFRIGKFIGPALGAWLAASFSLEAPFLIVGLLHGGAGLLILASMPPDAPHPAASMEAQAAPGHAPLLRVLRDHWRTLGVAGVGQIGVFIVRNGTTAIVPLYGEVVLGLDVQTIGLIVSVGALMDVVLFYPGGMVMDRFGRKFAIVPSFLTQALGMALIPLSTGAGGLLLAASLIGFGNGISAGTMMTVGADLAPPDARGEFLGAWRFVGDLGSVSGPLIVGGVGGLFSLQVSALVVAATGVMAAVVFGLGVPETLRRRSAESATT